MTSPLTYTSEEISDRTGISEPRVRQIVRQECAALIPDELRMIPGGRVDDKVLVIYAGIYDAVTRGYAVTHTSPVSLAPSDMIRRVS